MSNRKTFFFEKNLLFLPFFPVFSRKITFWCYIFQQKKEKEDTSA